MHDALRQAARDTWATLSLLLASKDVATVILVDGKHAKATAARFEKGLKRSNMVSLQFVSCFTQNITFFHSLHLHPTVSYFQKREISDIHVLCSLEFSESHTHAQLSKRAVVVLLRFRTL